METASLHLYCENTFRITGLPVDASAKEIKKHADRLKMMEELGCGDGANPAAFTLNPPPTVDQIRGAIQRLNEPEHRLVDEFFWFWPQEFGNSAADPAIVAMLSGDSDTAFHIWSGYENHPELDFVASHNIAVMFHLIALDWTIYHLAADVDSERETKILSYWEQSFSRWEKVVADDRIWDTVKERIRSMNDARLTTGFARRMREALPAALDKINAQAALKFASDRGRLDIAKRHVRFMRQTHNGLDDVDKTSDLVLRPIVTRVKHLINSARKANSINANQGATEAQNLLEHCLPLLEIYELFHGKTAHQKTELFDEVADVAADCLISYQKKTGNNRRFVELMRHAKGFATSIHLQKRIDEGIDAGEQNILYESLEPILKRLKEIEDRQASCPSQLASIKTDIVPYLETLRGESSATPDIIRELSNAIAIALRRISIRAHNDDRDYTTALKAVRLAGTIAKESTLRTRLSEDEATLVENLAQYKSTLVDMQIKGDRVIVNEKTFAFNQTSIPASKVTAIRFGIFIQYRNGVKSSVSYLIEAISGPTGISIECKRFWRSEEQAAADYKTILNGVFQHIIPGLSARIATSIRGGASYPMGRAKLTKDGIHITIGRLMWEKEHFLPWKDVRYATNQGVLTIRSNENPKITAEMSIRETWNAVLFSLIVDKL